MINLVKFKKHLIVIKAILLLLTSNSLSSDIFEIEADKIQYKDSNNLIIAEGNAIAKNKHNKKISADKIIYFKKDNKVQTFKNSKFEDGINTLTAENFIYLIKEKTLEADKSVIFSDKQNNKYFFDNLKYFEENEKIFGKITKSKINGDQYFEAEEVNSDNKNQISIFKKAKYTTCSKIYNNKDEFCPSWSLNSGSITHDKKNKKIIHKNALLKIKNVPILYSPYFSHPDPSVKRQSGLLPPVIKTITGIGRTVSIPYFWAISDDKDLTITPNYYLNEHSIINTSYRQATKNGFLEIVNGYSEGYKKLNKQGRSGGSRNYLFIDYTNNLGQEIKLNKNLYHLKVQRISQENFVRVNKINTPLFKEDIRNLENSVSLAKYSNDKMFNIKTGIFENLDTNDDEKYTYYLPEGTISLNSKILKNYNTNFNTYFLGKKFLDNQRQFKVRNSVFLNSKSFNFRNSGISNMVKISLLNNNIYNNNVTNQKQNENIDNYLTIGLDNSLPLIKYSKNKYSTIIPRVFVKFTNGKTNFSENTKILNYSDLYSMNRTNDYDAPETGLSAGYGFMFNQRQKKINSSEILHSLDFGLGQVFRDKKENNLPVSSSLNEKQSDFTGFFNFKFNGKKIEMDLLEDEKINFLDNFRNNNLGINYNFNINNNLNSINRNDIEIFNTYNKYYTSLKFSEKNQHIGSERNALINFKKLFKNNYYFDFEAKKDLAINRSEYNKFSLNYENDCIKYSFAISNNFYKDKDIESSKSLIFGITIKPFSDSFAPDLSSFVK